MLSSANKKRLRRRVTPAALLLALACNTERAAQTAPAPPAAPAPAAGGATDAAAIPSPLAARPRVYARSYKAMGTEVTFSAWIDDREHADRGFEAAHAELQRIEGLMTDWERPGQPVSDVVAINKAAGKSAVKVSPETLMVIEESLQASRRSDGAFDITYAAMRGLWKFDEDLERKVPPAGDIARRRKLINWRDVVVNRAASTVKLRRAGMRLGLGGIAKGYAVDRCATVMRHNGLSDFMIQAGGDLFVSGQKGDTSWMVGVRDPRGEATSIIARMPIKDQAFSTAGDYERAFILDGKRYHHIIDPKTGYPAAAARGVTILAPSALVADALDDAVFILGPERGLALVEKYPDCAALIVGADNKVWMSKSLEGKLQRTGPPSDGI
jgi:thiamine biosynthesis lipoprotein